MVNNNEKQPLFSCSSEEQESDGDPNKGALLSGPDAKPLLVDASMGQRVCRAKN
jgi:hypothetical protein